MGQAAKSYATARSGVLEDVLRALAPWLDRAEAKSERVNPALI